MATVSAPFLYRSFWIDPLAGAGWDGWYDVEVFSDNGLFGNDYPDSVWSRPAAEVARDSVAKFMHLWNTMKDVA